MEAPSPTEISASINWHGIMYKYDQQCYEIQVTHVGLVNVHIFNIFQLEKNLESPQSYVLII